MRNGIFVKTMHGAFRVTKFELVVENGIVVESVVTQTGNEGEREFNRHWRNRNVTEETLAAAGFRFSGRNITQHSTGLAQEE